MKKIFLSFALTTLLQSQVCLASLGGVDAFIRPYYLEYLLIVGGLTQVPNLCEKLKKFFLGDNQDEDPAIVEYVTQLEELLEQESLEIGHNVLSSLDRVREKNYIATVKEKIAQTFQRRRCKSKVSQVQETIMDDQKQVLHGFQEVYEKRRRNKSKRLIPSDSIQIKKIAVKGRDIRSLYEIQCLKNDKPFFCMAKSFKDQNLFEREDKRMQELQDFVKIQNDKNSVLIVKYKGSFTTTFNISFMLLTKAEGQKLYDFIHDLVFLEKSEKMVKQSCDENIKHIGTLVGRLHADYEKYLLSADGTQLYCLSFAHNDLHWGNIFYDRDKRTITIIDYADMFDPREELGDLSRDLNLFFAFQHGWMKYCWRSDNIKALEKYAGSLLHLGKKEQENALLQRRQELNALESGRVKNLDLVMDALKEGYLSMFAGHPDLQRLLDEMICEISETITEELPCMQ